MSFITHRSTGTKTMSTSPERVDQLMTLSRPVYEAIEEYVGGEKRSRRILRLGINAVAQHLNSDDSLPAGEIYQSLLFDQLGRGGVSLSHYGAWPHYQSRLQTLPSVSNEKTTDLNDLANKYADVKRATRGADEKRERNATHSIHLSALALPYAAEYHSELDLNKIAVYCLVHDILEAYTGDVPTLGISREAMQEKYDAEEQALKILALEYGMRWPRFVQVVKDYEALADIEARFVKTFDKLDPSFTHFANSGTQLLKQYGYRTADQFLDASHESTKRILEYGADFPDLMSDRNELLFRVAHRVDWPGEQQIAVHP